MLIPWYVLRGGERVGPFNWQTLREMTLRDEVAAEDLVWTPAQGTKWLPAREALATVFDAIEREAKRKAEAEEAARDKAETKAESEDAAPASEPSHSEADVDAEKGIEYEQRDFNRPLRDRYDIPESERRYFSFRYWTSLKHAIGIARVNFFQVTTGAIWSVVLLAAFFLSLGREDTVQASLTMGVNLVQSETELAPARDALKEYMDASAFVMSGAALATPDAATRHITRTTATVGKIARALQDWAPRHQGRIATLGLLLCTLVLLRAYFAAQAWVMIFALQRVALPLRTHWTCSRIIAQRVFRPSAIVQLVALALEVPLLLDLLRIAALIPTGGGALEETMEVMNAMLFPCYALIIVETVKRMILSLFRDFITPYLTLHPTAKFGEAWRAFRAGARWGWLFRWFCALSVYVSVQGFVCAFIAGAVLRVLPMMLGPVALALVVLPFEVVRQYWSMHVYVAMRNGDFSTLPFKREDKGG